VLQEWLSATCTGNRIKQLFFLANFIHFTFTFINLLPTAFVPIWLLYSYWFYWLLWWQFQLPLHNNKIPTAILLVTTIVSRTVISTKASSTCNARWIVVTIAELGAEGMVANAESCREDKCCNDKLSWQEGPTKLIDNLG